jgi:hypothetical protein
MKSAKIFIVFTFLLTFVLQVSAQKSKGKQIALSSQDKKEIIKQVFDDGFEKLFKSSEFSQCLTPIVNEKKVIFFMSSGAKKYLSADFREYRFIFMSYSQISEEVKRNNGECYFELTDFQISNSKVRINLSRIIGEIYRFPNSPKYTRWISGVGYSYEFEKVNKDWRIISVGQIIISS